MNAMMFLSTNTAAFLVFAGFAVAAFSGLWSLVVAAQRSILWLLAVIFIPFASIIILFVEPRSRKPFFIGLCATIAVIVGGIRIDQASGESDSKPVQVIEEVIRKAKGQQLEAAQSEDVSLEERKRRIGSWQKEIAVKKTALKPNDAAARAAFDEEFKRYMTALEKVKADMANQPK